MVQEKIRKKRWDFSTPDAIFEIEGLDIYEQTLYILLCSHADREGKSFPSYETLARRGRMSKRKAIDSVAKLVKVGLLTKEKQFKNGGAVTSNQYVINDAYDFMIQQEPGGENDQNNEDEPPEDETPKLVKGDAQDAPGGCTPCTGGVHDMHPNIYHINNNHNNNINNIPPKKTKNTRLYSEDDAYYKMAIRFHELAYKNAEEEGNAHLIKTPNFQKWADVFRLMHERDNVGEEIGETVKFAMSDPFYRTIILSPTNLRKHYLAIRKRMTVQKGGGNYGRGSGLHEHKGNTQGQRNFGTAQRVGAIDKTTKPREAIDIDDTDLL